MLTFLYHLLCTAQYCCTKPGEKQHTELRKDSAMYGEFLLEQPFLDICKLFWCCTDLKLFLIVQKEPVVSDLGIRYKSYSTELNRI